VVTEDGETIGRMYRDAGAQIEVWCWFAHFGRSTSGRAASPDQAKQAFLRAWNARPK
jgi:hypothetical protein